MIQSKEDLKYYIACDLKALDVGHLSLGNKLYAYLCPCIWKFQIMLRKQEYLENCKASNIIQKIYLKLYRCRVTRYGLKLGFSVPSNVFGPGLCLCHAGTIVVNEHTKAGANVRIHAGVNIGNYSRFDANWQEDCTPTIGDNVYIGPGAKIFGKITIGDDAAIGANAVVNKDVAPHTTVAGIPANVINNRGSQGLIIRGHIVKES